MVALTRNGRSEAISRGERMKLWIAPQRGEYGLRAEAAKPREGTQPVEFKMAQKLGITLPRETLDKQGEAAILFWPDGSIDEESPDVITITEGGIAKREIALSENASEFVVQEAQHAPK